MDKHGLNIVQAGVTSLLTAALLHAAPSCTPTEAQPQHLPSNFLEVACHVLRFLNATAELHLGAFQTLLGV